MKKFFKILLLSTFLLVFANGVYSAEKDVLLKTTTTWDGLQYNKIRVKHPEVTVLKIKIGVGEALPMHMHTITNIAYVNKGILTVVTEDGKSITVKEGDCLPEVVGKYHYGKNTGDMPVELIVFYLGEKDTPLSINKK